MAYIPLGCRDSSFGIATRYGLDRVPVGVRFSVPSRPDLRHTPNLLYNGTFLGVKRPERGADHPPPTRVWLRMGWRYTSAFPLCLSRHMMGWPLSFTFLTEVLQTLSHAYGDSEEQNKALESSIVISN